MKPKLTKQEFNAVAAFIKAARELPPTICISVEDPKDGYGTLFVQKRVSPWEAGEVAKLNKPSLFF